MSLVENVEYIEIKMRGREPVRHPASRLQVRKTREWIGVVIRRDAK